MKSVRIVPHYYESSLCHTCVELIHVSQVDPLTHLCTPDLRCGAACLVSLGGLSRPHRLSCPARPPGSDQPRSKPSTCSSTDLTVDARRRWKDKTFNGRAVITQSPRCDDHSAAAPRRAHAILINQQRQTFLWDQTRQKCRNLNTTGSNCC